MIVDSLCFSFLCLPCAGPPSPAWSRTPWSSRPCPFSCTPAVPSRSTPPWLRGPALFHFRRRHIRSPRSSTPSLSAAHSECSTSGYALAVFRWHLRWLPTSTVAHAGAPGFHATSPSWSTPVPAALLCCSTAPPSPSFVLSATAWLPAGTPLLL